RKIIQPEYPTVEVVGALAVAHEVGEVIDVHQLHQAFGRGRFGCRALLADLAPATAVIGAAKLECETFRVGKEEIPGIGCPSRPWSGDGPDPVGERQLRLTGRKVRT